MISKIFSTAAEVTAELVVFVLAFFLSTGLTCGGKPLCELRDQQAKVAAP